jgi:hypothetical protein
MSSTGHQGKIAIIRHWKNSFGNLNGIHWQGPIDLSSSGSDSDYYCITVKQPEKSENQGRNSNVFIAVVAISDREDLFAGVYQLEKRMAVGQGFEPREGY